MKDIKIKICTKCGIEKKATTDNFNIKKNGKFGLDSRCRDCRKIYFENYRKINRELLKEKHKKYYKENKDKHGCWATKNADKVKRYKKKYDKKRRSTLKGKLEDRMSRAINKVLKNGKNGMSWESLVGYNCHDLKKHLESLFADGMNWENIGDWHIDHKVPKSVFNYTNHEHEDFKRCWALDNLQPLWAKDNLSKNDRLEKPFQPSLLL